MFYVCKPRAISIALTALALLLLSIQSLPSASAIARSCAQGGVCTLGDIGPGGGKVFYVAPTTFPCGPTGTESCKYLEFSRSGASAPWSKPAFISTLIGSTAQFTSIGTGYKNTLAIINQQGSYDLLTNKYAAGAAYSYSAGLIDDWYIPSKDELTELYLYIRAASQPALAYVAASTEFDDAHTWGIYTPIAGQTIGSGASKNDSNVVVPIRAFTISPSTAPSAPTLSSVTAGDRQITITFTEGLDNGSAFTDYEYSLNGGTYISAATTTSPFTITSGISGRTSYSVTLKARNSVGLGSASGSLSATTTDSSADASEAAAVAAESARVAAVNAAIAAEAAKRAVEQKEMSELLAVLPSIAGLALNIGDLTNSLLAKQKCVNGKKTKTVSYGSKCPKGYVKRK
jgi:hypothetical protein